MCDEILDAIGANIHDWYQTGNLMAGIRDNDFWKSFRAMNGRADINFSNGLPLLEAIHRKNNLTVLFLSSKGADLDVRHGLPLVTAVARGHISMVDLLLREGGSRETDVFARGMGGHLEEAMAVAKTCGDTGMEYFLKKHGAVEPRSTLTIPEIREHVFMIDRNLSPKTPFLSLALATALAFSLAAGGIWLAKPEEKSAPTVKKAKTAQAEVVPQPKLKP